MIKLSKDDGVTFTRYIFRDDGTIRFALPIPGRDDLTYTIYDDGTLKLDAEIEDYEKAWTDFCTAEYGGTDRIVTLQTLLPGYEPKNRTRKRAGAVDPVPDVIATPSTPELQYAMSLYESRPAAAHVVPISPEVALSYTNGVLYFDGVPSSQIRLIDVRTKDVASIDLMPLRVMYGVILQKLVKALQEQTADMARIADFTVHIYVPELMSAMGLKANTNQKTADLLIAKIRSYQSVIGIMPERLGSRVLESKYPILVWMGYDAKKDVISFASPYLNKIVVRAMEQSVQKDRKGVPIRKKNGLPVQSVSHSYLMKASIASERNKRAVEIVSIVCLVIEQAGSTTPHIKASTIIERHPELRQALENSSSPSNRNRILQSAFKKAWELLDTQTYLKDKYKNIRFPTATPTMGTLDMIFEFPHEGKLKK